MGERRFIMFAVFVYMCGMFNMFIQVTDLDGAEIVVNDLERR